MKSTDISIELNYIVDNVVVSQSKQAKVFQKSLFSGILATSP